jgi:hypothetical protein
MNLEGRDSVPNSPSPHSRAKSLHGINRNEEATVPEALGKERATASFWKRM